MAKRKKQRHGKNRWRVFILAPLLFGIGVVLLILFFSRQRPANSSSTMTLVASNDANPAGPTPVAMAQQTAANLPETREKKEPVVPASSVSLPKLAPAPDKT